MKNLFLASIFVFVLCAISYGQTPGKSGSSTSGGKTGGQTSGGGKAGGQTSGGRTGGQTPGKSGPTLNGKIDISTPSNSGGQTPGRTGNSTPSTPDKTKIGITPTENGDGARVTVSVPIKPIL